MTPARRAGRPRAGPPTSGKGRGPKLRLVRPRRSRRLPFYVAAFLSVGVLVVAVVALQAIASQTSFRMQQLEQRSASLQQRWGQLRLEEAQLSAPARLAREARRLGLELPGPGQVHTLRVQPDSGARSAPSGGSP